MVIQFGREWDLSISSPKDALSLIDANKPGVFVWIRNNLKKYDNYRVVAESEDGAISEVSQDEYIMTRRCKSIRFVPLIRGAGSTLTTIAGVALIAVDYMTGYVSGGTLTTMGLAMVAGGIAMMLAPKPKANKEPDKRDSFYFDGPENTTTQGVPVPVIYGRTMTGSCVISAAITVDQLL